MFKLAELFGKKNQYDEATQSIIESWHKVALENDKIDAMKQTEGWQIIEQKIREEIRMRIVALVAKEDPDSRAAINTLLQILGAVDTSKTNKILEEEVDKFISET
jgi:hypothetical protein